MNIHDIIKIKDLEFDDTILNSGNISGVKTINGNIYPPESEIPRLDLVLNKGNDADGIGIINLLDLTFTEDISISDSNNNIISSISDEIKIFIDSTQIISFKQDSIDFKNNIIPTCNTAIYGTNTRHVATTEFVQSALTRNNNLSLPFKIQGIVNNIYPGSTDSQWIFPIPENLGNGFSFYIYTNNTNLPTYTVQSGDIIELQGNVISAEGYGTIQKYTVEGFTYTCYVLTLMGYAGTTYLIFQTSTSVLGPIYTLKCYNSTYFSVFNIDMTMIIYPSNVYNPL